MSAMQAKVTASGGTFDVAALTDGDLAKATLLPAAPVNERAWIQYEFPQAQTIRGLTFITSGGGGARGGGVIATELEASDDGSQFRTVVPIPAGARTIAFAPVTARFFRVTILTPPPQQTQNRGGTGGVGVGIGGGQRAQTPAAPAGTQVAEFVLHSARRQPVPGESRVLCGHEHLCHGHAGGSDGRGRAQVGCHRPDRRKCAQTARSTGRLRPGTGWCCASATR